MENEHGIAIIGLSCRFPQASDPQAFWQLLVEGRAVFQPMPESRKHLHSADNLDKIRGGFLDNPYQFDPEQFHISEQEALYMDPQQRVMLELAVEAIKDAGYTEWSNRLVGVFVGANQLAYQEMITSRWYRRKAVDHILKSETFQRIPVQIRQTLQAELDAVRNLDQLPTYALVGVLSNMIPGRIAHELNLKGPALAVDTACSSSLVAVHLACASLYQRECDWALAGGVNLNLTPSVFHYMDAAGVISPSGKCIPFSRDSDGILLGEGAGMVALKRLEDAVRDQDPIWAVIRGSGINNDGRSMGLMAPGWKGQLALLENTYARSGYDPGKISAIEAHGTSTRIGDGVELAVIEKFFPLNPEQPVSLGSVKSNIGHTLGTSGIAGLIKMVLAIHHKQLPPTLHEKIDPKNKLAEKGIHLQSDLADWISPGLRSAGVSSFGFGGTNAHLILEEPEKTLAFRPKPYVRSTGKTLCYDFFPQLTPSNKAISTLVWEGKEHFPQRQSFDPRYWVLFGFEQSDLQRLQEELSKQGKRSYGVYCETKGDATAFIRLGEHHFSIDPGNTDHFKWLMDNFPKEDTIGAFFLATGSVMDAAPLVFVRKVLSGFRFLTQVLKQRNTAKLWVTTFGAYQVSASEQSHPNQRALATLANGALEENPALRGALADLSPAESTMDVRLFAIPGVTALQPMVIRGDRQFEPVLKPIKATQVGVDKLRIRPGGVYLILGGSSGIGALMAEHIAKQAVRKVIVTGTRSIDELPPRLRALMPDKVVYWQSDIAEKEALAALINELYEHHGVIDGIVYAAGRIVFGSLHQKNQEDFEKVLLAKMEGISHLGECLENRQPDFVYLISSIAGLTPTWAGGMADYAAANAFLDAFAEKQYSNTTSWISCSWGLWENTGMATSLEGDRFKGFSPEEALQIFESTLALGLPHVVALPDAQQSLFSGSFSEKSTKSALESEHIPDVVAPIIKHETRNEPAVTKVPENDLTTLIKQLIAEAVQMPVEEIDENASFYQFGLDSLSAVDVAQKIEQQIGVALHPTILFEHDTIVSLGKYLAQHSGRMVFESATASYKAPKDANFPLIGAQKTFYAQQQFYPEKPCNVLVNVTIRHRFDPAKLQAAWNQLTERHDALRLAFEMTDEGPIQYVHVRIEAPVEFNVCADYTAVLALEDTLVNQVFDLEHPPFFRLIHVSLEADQSVLMLMMHHLIFDAWSMYVLLKELLEVYAQNDLTGKPALKSNDASFEDYVKFHQETLLKRDLSGIKAYWIQALDNAVWGMPLPYRKSPRARSKFSMVVGELGASGTAFRMQQNQELRLSIFHSMLAAYFLALQKHTGRDDMIIRVANANRDAAFPEVESLTGCLADALPIRVKIQAGDDLTAVAIKVKQQMLDALRHAGLSSQDIAELPIGRQDDGPVVLSPVGLSFVPMHHLSRDSSLQFHAIRCRTALPFTDISLICFMEDNNLKCCWNYDEALFESTAITQLNDTFLHILGGPSASASLTPPLDLPEIELFPSIALLHEKVWAACAQYKHHMAVVSAEGDLTYAELADQSKQLANTLIGQLKQAEETVGIFAYPGKGAVIGLTGILASGRAFVPLDPDWPSGRIETIVMHAGIRTVVTTASLLPGLLNYSAIETQLDTIILSDDLETPPLLAGGNLKIMSIQGAHSSPILTPPFDLSAGSLAYVMYTSGTSGHLKGVMVSHQTVAVFLNWVSETFQIAAKDRFIHTSSLGFGGSIRQVFSTLLAGASIYPIARGELKDPQALYRFLERHKITLLNTVPSVVNNLLDWVTATTEDLPEIGRLQSLRYVLLGGETLYAETVDKWWHHLGRHSKIVNLYGSTETIVNATAYFIDSEAPNYKGSIPIGYQKKGSLVRLVNEKGALCAPGEVGQIYVGGPCLANGYYREQALSEEKFVLLDLTGQHGVFYSTGDLAQSDESGLLHFIGRNDDQIQLYGNRIELTEIEDTIYQTHQVKNTAVVDRQTDGQHWLAAFVELVQTGIKPTGQQIRDFISQRLPSYMVPHKIILLDRMPLNQAGKTDRVALRRMLAAELAVAGNEPEAERSMRPTEMIIATVWQKLLHIHEVQKEDDFFRLGGDSIKALEMLHQLQKHFTVLPKAVTLFRDRKLSALAESIDRLNNKVSLNQIIPLPAELPTNRNALSPSQKGFVLLQKLLPSSAPNWAGLLRFQGNYQADVLTQALDYLLIRHPMLRTVFVSESAQMLQQVLTVEKAPVAFSDLTDQSPEAQQEVLENAFYQIQGTDFDLSKYPLFKVHLFQTGLNSGVLLLCIHHIITDGWSTHVLLNDLLRVYDQIMDGGIPDLGPAPPLYTECIPLLSGAVATTDNPGIEVQQAYWEKALADLPAFTPPEDTDPARGPHAGFILPASTKEQLLNWSKQHDVTLYNLMITLYARALMQLNHLESLLINTAVNGRDLPVEHIQQVIGCFARNLPLRIDLNPQADLLSAVKLVEQVFYSALEHQEIPPTDLFKIAVKTGYSTAIFSVNRFYFSFMDFSALEKYNSRHISLLWDESKFSFNAGGAGAEIMMGVNVGDTIRISLNGYASPTTIAHFKSIFLKEIDQLTGRPNTINSALIAYLPGGAWMESALPGAPTAKMIDYWKRLVLGGDQAKLLEQVITPIGVSGVVFLPFDADQLREFSQEKRTQEILKAIRVAIAHGATHVSMAGILPAITNYGYAIAQAIKAAGAHFPTVALTTGHASTVVAVVKTIQKVLHESETRIQDLKVAVLGFGSIGQASISLLLNVLGHPVELIVADLEAQLPLLNQPLADLKARYSGKLTIAVVRSNHMPDELYNARLIIGASSSGQVLEVARFRPGTLFIDDSFPPAINIQSGIHRMQQDSDVLLLGGGKLKVCEQQQSQLAPEVPEKMVLPLLRSLGMEGMPGCRVEPLILQNAPDLPPTIGLVEEKIALQYWDKITALGIEAVEFHLAGYMVPENLVKKVSAIINRPKT